ncbi:MAG: hypothetical protein ACOCZE_05410, partial [Planctomycetota bacterium]
NKKNKKMFDRQEVHERIAMFCNPCHKTVHATLSEKELEQVYNDVESLRQHPDIARFVKWVRKQPSGTNIRVRTSQGKRDRTSPRDRRGRRR